jgi:hypothetical protein
MSSGRHASYSHAGTVMALLVVALLLSCLVHTDTSGSDDPCLNLGPLTHPGAAPPLLPAGPADPPLTAAHRVVPADQPVPPPRA